ncbi:Heat shock protein [Lachnellula suecica]|uniref:Heat shock protein n=1 Tax=Lachnellula suecica TaxID=602035 RepID=A0A8T9CNT2_9HELO|nr:Heat shock protein [Lachnellula suecica]
MAYNNYQQVPFWDFETSPSSVLLPKVLMVLTVLITHVMDMDMALATALAASAAGDTATSVQALEEVTEEGVDVAATITMAPKRNTQNIPKARCQKGLTADGVLEVDTEDEEDATPTSAMVQKRGTLADPVKHRQTQNTLKAKLQKGLTAHEAHEEDGMEKEDPEEDPGDGGIMDMDTDTDAGDHLLAALSGHPLAQAFRGFAEQNAGAQTTGETDDENNFVPPIDIFSTEKQFVLHVSLPGAKKEDVGVNWDDEKGVLNVAGVVYRHGDEEFLNTLAQSERKVGAFERTVKLPPGNGAKEEIDGDGITAKLEDGVLVVTVPRIEKEWTEVKRVDIE